MIDLNLLGSRFSTALANTLERAFARSEGFAVPEPHQPIVVMGAAAGAD
jgi:hypothetical protein